MSETSTEAEGAMPPINGPSRLQRAALIAEIIGAIAIVLSVVYLALQITSNNKLLQSQAYFNFLTLGHSTIEMLAEDPELADLILTCDQTPYEVSDAEWARCGRYYFVLMNSWEYTYYQNGEGVLPEGLVDGADAYFRSFLVNPGYRRFWDEYRLGYGEPFRSYFEDAFPDLPEAEE